MIRLRHWLPLAALALWIPSASAQPFNRGGDGWSPLKPGESFPEVSVHDADGKAFNTKSLKGKYTVIVNGCLT